MLINIQGLKRLAHLMSLGYSKVVIVRCQYDCGWTLMITSNILVNI